MKKFYFTIIILGHFFVANSLHSQEITNIDSTSIFNALSKGKHFFGVGTNFNTSVAKNEDDFIIFILDEENTRFNIKLAFGYNIRDNHPVGIAFRHFYDKENIVYENTLRDTISSNSVRKDYITNIFYGVTKPLFNSKKVYLISDPSIFFGFGNTKTNRSLEGESEFSASYRYSVSLGLNVGILVFLSPKMAVQATIGPVGAGYEWENFELEGESNGYKSDFFVRMSPNLLNLEFSISRYF